MLGKSVHGVWCVIRIEWMRERERWSGDVLYGQISYENPGSGLLHGEGITLRARIHGLSWMTGASYYFKNLNNYKLKYFGALNAANKLVIKFLSFLHIWSFLVYTFIHWEIYYCLSIHILYYMYNMIKLQ